MPGMYGADLLGRSRLLHPRAKRVMLVSWGDARSPETLPHSCAVGDGALAVTSAHRVLRRQRRAD